MLSTTDTVTDAPALVVAVIDIEASGIARDTVLRHGRPAEDVARWLNRELAGQVVYCDGWAHDCTWLGVLYEAAGLQPLFRLEHILRLLDADQASRLGPLRQAVGSKAPGTRHRASSDARLLQRALTELRAPA